MIHEEKQIHNAVHVELREFEEFKALVRKMREAQEEEMILDGNEDIEFIGNIVTNARKLEFEVDEYLKIN